MAQPISSYKALEMLRGNDSERDAIVNPVTNTESYLERVESGISNAGANISNLLGNVGLSFRDDINPIDNAINKYNNKDNSILGAIEGGFESSKELFKSPYKQLSDDKSFGGGVAMLLDATSQNADLQMKQQKDLEKKNDKVGQYASGGLGNFLADLTLAIPTMTLGSMKLTKEAIEAGVGASGIAKSIGQDAFRNANVFGSSEFALTKLYGGSDEEAVSNALVGKIVGSFGTPMVGGALGLKEFLKTDAKGLAQIKLELGEELTAEEMAILAGGGKAETKSGRKINSDDVQSSNKTLQDIEFNFSSPVKERTPLPENEYVPTTNNPLKFKYRYDERGRVYAEDANMLSPQGTADQKASLEIKPKESIESAQKEVARRLEFYDRDEQLRKSYGQSQARFKNENTTPEDVYANERLNFVKDQYADIMKDKNLDRAIRAEARDRLLNLNKQSIKTDNITPDIISKAETKFEEQSVVKRPEAYSERDKSLREEFKIFTEKRGDKIGFERKPLNTIQEAVTNVTKKATASRLDVKKAIALVNKQERLKGKPMFDEANITTEQRKAYPKEIQLIDDFQARREDIILHRKGQILDDEFRFREKRRIDNQVSREASTFNSEADANVYSEKIAKELADIGIYQDLEKSKVKIDKKPEQTGIKPNKQFIKEKEASELEKSKKQHEFLIGALERYRKTKKIERNNKGRQVLSESQRLDVDEGILSHKDIADKTSPISINSKRQEIIDNARTNASKKVNNFKARELGIKDRFGLPDNITFKNTVKDASNSVAQITTVLLGSKRLAKLSKLYGGDTDIRNIIADVMTKAGVENATKATVKPLFMTENYGQMRKGLVENVMKDQKTYREKAERFVDEYYKASDAIAPEMVKLKDVVFDTFKKSGKSEFYWKLPDGFEVKFKLTLTKDGMINIQGDNYKVKIKTDEFNEFSRAIMPNIIHSVDAYVARQMNAKGFPTVHDAYVIPKGKEKIAEMQYSRIMAEINDSNLLDDILRDIGYKGESLKVGDLPSEAIRKSEFKLSNEHIAGESEPSKLREFDVSRQKTSEEVMRDYMASGNYRQIPTNQLIDSMVNEAGFNNSFSKMAREGDDVYERQIALAMQSEKYNEKLAIKAPDGVNAKVFDKVQRDIFNEARAKLEYNPLLKDVIQGERIYFDKNGKLIGDTIKSIEQLIIEEKRIAKKLLKSKSNSERKIFGSPEQVMSKASSMKNDYEYNYNDIRVKAMADDVHNEVITPKWNNYKTLWKEQVSNEPKYNEFNRLESIANVYRQEVDRTAEILHTKLSKIDNIKQEKIMKLVKSDYEAIRGMDKETALRIWKENQQIREIAWREIRQGARGLGNQSEQYGAYLPNPHLIAVRYNLPSSAEPIIDQLISIKAMTDNKGWQVLDELKGDKELEFVLDTMREKRLLSEGELFYDSPEKITKGYISEVYRGNKKITEDGKVVYDADSKYEEGVLGADRENNKVGTLFEVNDKLSFKSIDEELAFMEKNRLRKTDGKYRKVTAEDIKIEAGKVDNLADVITDTIRNTHMKVKERGLVYKVLKDLSMESLLFSKTPKQGMQKLTNEQSMRLPYDLRGELVYVDRDLATKLLGRDEVRLYRGENQNLKIADRLLDNLGTMFKQNVVLKNPASYLNSLLVNQTIGLSAGLSPKELYKYQRQAMKDISDMKFVLEELTKRKLTGKELDKALVNRLNNNKLFRMERAGLSTNRVEGVVGDDDLISSILADHVPSPIFKMARLLNLNQKTTAGRFTLRTFSTIDTMGRYSLTEKFLSQGMSMQEAVMKTNGLFGDMDKMVPSTVEMLDKYGFVPFLKWFTLTSPQLIKLTKDNPKKALAVGIGVYLFAQETNRNLSTVNPIEAMVDFFEGSLPFGTIEKVQKQGLLDTASNRASSNVIPKYLSIAYKNPFDLVNKLKKERIGKPSGKNKVDYRGFTQQVIEGD